MRFVPLKDGHQQATLCLHRTRRGLVEERTATYNRLRGLLSEFGVASHHAGHIAHRLLEYDRATADCA
jgi:transposase